MHALWPLVVMLAACGGRLAVDDLRSGPTPIVHGRDVTFVAVGDPSDPPRIVADFNGWDPGAGAMKPAGDGLYILHVQLDPSARIEYLIAYSGRFVVDPRNPHQVPSPAGAPRSELRMAGYRPAAPPPRPGATGTLQNVPFTSRAGESRRVRVHRPAGINGPTPLLYVHDGGIAVEGLDMPAMLDGLGASGQVAPITTVFINSLDRHEDFAVGSMFSYVFMGEIVPAIERRYPFAGVRGVMGFSRSTVGALDAAFNGTVRFTHAGLVAPAMNPPTLASLLEAPRATPHVTVLAGTYDIPLIDDARALRSALESRRVPPEWIEYPEGHNHTAWRSHVPRLLRSWFPPGPGSLSPKGRDRIHMAGAAGGEVAGHQGACGEQQD